MIEGKIIVITGATSGIGAQLAFELDRLGAMVIATGRNEDNLKSISAQLRHNSLYYKMDVTNNEQIELVFQQIISEFGRVDILINNAGYGKFVEINECTIHEYEQMMDTNYMGVVRCTKAILPYMKSSGEGHIINIASLAGKIGSAKSTSYSATKHAVLGFTDSLRMEIRAAKVPITVSSVNPGPIRTPFFDKADPQGNYVNNISWLLMEPDFVVKKIIVLIRKKRSEISLPNYAGIALKLYGLFPRLIDKIAGRWMNQK